MPGVFDAREGSRLRRSRPDVAIGSSRSLHWLRGPGGRWCFCASPRLYDRLMSQFRRSRRRRLRQESGPGRTAGSLDSENRRRDRPRHIPPSVHWELEPPVAQGRKSEAKGHATKPGSWALSPRETMPGSVSQGSDPARDWNARRRVDRGRPMPEWDRGRDTYVSLVRRRPIDHRRAEKSRLGHSLRTCRVQPARRNKSRRLGRAE